jgi:hypothetical protein
MALVEKEKVSLGKRIFVRFDLVEPNTTVRQFPHLLFVSMNVARKKIVSSRWKL